MIHTKKDTMATHQPDSDEKSGKKQLHNYDVATGKIAKMMQQEYGFLGTGEMAELRRISPENPFTPALWRILLDLGLDKPPQGIKLMDWERRWATFLMGMAICNGMHDYEMPFGRALAN